MHQNEPVSAKKISHRFDKRRALRVFAGTFAINFVGRTIVEMWMAGPDQALELESLFSVFMNSSWAALVIMATFGFVANTMNRE